MKNAKHVFIEFLVNNKIRWSVQREHIVDVFLKTERHLTADELYHLVREKYPGTGYATVYRTLKLMSQAGLTEEVDLGDGAVRYEHKHGHEHHDHMVCLKCGKFIEVVDTEVEKLLENLAQRHGFQPLKHKMDIFGTCRNCTG